MKNMKSTVKVISDYLKARNDFIEYAEKHPDMLSGNDNMIGRIGEFLAFRWLFHTGRKPTRPKTKTEKGFDFFAQGKRISVKLITNENKSGTTTKLQEPWDELILIELNTKKKSYTMGHITKGQFKKALREKLISNSSPTISRTMLKDEALFYKFGKRFKEEWL